MALDVELPPGIQFAAASRVVELAFRGEEIQDIQAELDELKELVAQATEGAQKGLRVA